MNFATNTKVLPLTIKAKTLQIYWLQEHFKLKL